MGASFGLTFDDASQANLSFDRVTGYMSRNDNLHVKALLIGFWKRQHMVALVRENAGTFQFYDANVGSYRIQTNGLRNFLSNYNDVCLPNKWPDYNQASTVAFSSLFVVSRRL
ncbi:hypothetical protein C8R34_11921 [Nitrosomonas sp. Nm84]|uniref:hypothetical protein n=1 Tax=Nitrosomonas sp. Nm84 TaxID=200124 RepID=UPI000D763459|nr:hypothetical protein [Nitrosomonas sp. Nm84]PXW85469.1 hypothetical protein C8R34_11921 [Nitrosomonas sp. Nm84]